MPALDKPIGFVRTRLLGESVRECGVLVLIFAPLDILIEGNRTIDWPQPCLGSFCISWRHVALLFLAAIGIFLLYFGIKIESEAEWALRESETKDNDNAVSDGAV